ncbi:MAG: outer membrane beta-barrel protein [Planctomycetes bacterium]|nr:outer membrane beta-barrel protein [Planctomycetota bacterium]
MNTALQLALLLATSGLLGCASATPGPAMEPIAPGASLPRQEPMADQVTEYNFSLLLGYRRVPDYDFYRDQFLWGLSFDASPEEWPIGFEASVQWSGWQSDSGDWYGYWYFPEDQYREVDYLDLALGVRKCFLVADNVQVYAGAGATWVDAEQEEAILFPIFRKATASDSLWAPYVRAGVRAFVNQGVSVGLEATGIFAGDLDMLRGSDNGSSWSIALVAGFGF